MASASPACGPLDINQNIQGGRTAVLTIILVLWREPRHDVINVERLKNFALFWLPAEWSFTSASPRQRSEEWFIRKKMNKMIYYIIDYHKGAVLFWQRTIWLPLYRTCVCVRLCLLWDRCVIFIQTSLFREERRHSHCCQPLFFV